MVNKVDVFCINKFPLIGDDIIKIKIEKTNMIETIIEPLLIEKFVVPMGLRIKIKEIRITYEISNIIPPTKFGGF